MRLSRSLCLFISCFTVHGFVQVAGSSIVTEYSIVSRPIGVHRSTRCSRSLEPRKSDFLLKLVTSTTSVEPSHRPRESPHHWRTLAGRCGAPVIGTLRCQPCP